MADDHGKHGEGEGHAEGGHKKSHGGGHGAHGGGGHEEHGGVAEWLISFADNVALLMGFFVILLAMNMKKESMGGMGGEGKNPGGEEVMTDFVIAMRQGFNNPVSLDSTDPKDLPLIRRILERRAEEGRERGTPGDGRNVQSVRNSEWAADGGFVVFDTNSSVLTPTARKTAREIAAIIKGQRYVIEVRGHASAVEATEPEAAMKLGYQRAVALAAALAGEGVKWESMRMVSCGMNDRAMPIAYDPQQHRTNQRVEVVQTHDLLPEDPHLREHGEDEAGAKPPATVGAGEHGGE